MSYKKTLKSEETEKWERSMFRNSPSKTECKKKKLPYVEGDKLINTAAFCERANYFLEKGTYTHLKKKSARWWEFWREERRRCQEGVWLGQVRITGYHYYFLNYYPMIIANVDENEEVEEQFGFAKFWRIHFNLFHLLEYGEKIKKNLAFIKPRGCGASEIAASVGACDFEIPKTDKNGRRRFDKNVYYAAKQKYLQGQDGIINKVFKSITWINENAQTAIYQSNAYHSRTSDMHWVAGYRKKDNTGVQTGGEVFGAILNKPDDARSGRVKRIFWEESGANPKLGAALNVAAELTKRGRHKTGIHIIFGTSNAETEGIEAFKRVISYPDSYDCLKFRNVWKGGDQNYDVVKNVSINPFEYLADREEDGVGWFIPYYDYYVMDKHGNPDREEAYRQIMEERKQKEKDGLEDAQLYIADHPVTLEETWFRQGTNNFDKDILSKQYTDIVISKKYNKENKDTPYDVGNLVEETDEKGNKRIVFEHDLDGKFKIYEHPQTDEHGNPYKHLYVGGVDPIDTGRKETSQKMGSNFAMLVKKRISPNYFSESSNTYVAIYCYIPDYARESFNDARKLILYYNCFTNIERNKYGFISHMKDMGMINFLMRKPRLDNASQFTIDQNSEVIGTYANADINIHMDNLVREYIKDYGHTIMFPELLQELIGYRFETRTHHDLTVAMGLTELVSQEINHILPKAVVKESEDFEVFGYYRDKDGYKKYGLIPNKESFEEKMKYRNVFRTKEPGTGIEL